MNPADGIAKKLRGALIGQVRAVFNDQARGEKPVRRKPEESLFGPRSVVWRVHGDVTTMMVGGVGARPGSSR